MTSTEYNLTGVLGAKAASQNAKAEAHLSIELGGHNKVFAVANAIAAKSARAKRPLSKESPIVWTLEPKQVQLRDLIVAKLNNSDGLYAEPRGLADIAIIGQPEYRLA